MQAKRIDSTNLWLYYFQVPHLDSTCREIGDLELHTDRPLALAALSRTSHASSEAPCHATSVFVVAFHGRQA